MLTPYGQVVVCVHALPEQSSFRGQVTVFSDYGVNTMEVVIKTSQSISLPIVFNPEAVGNHSATLSLTATSDSVGEELDLTRPRTPVLVTMTGSAMIASNLNPAKILTNPQQINVVENDTLDSELVTFLDTKLGESITRVLEFTESSSAVEMLSISPALKSSPEQNVVDQSKGHEDLEEISCDQICAEDSTAGIKTYRILSSSGQDEFEMNYSVDDSIVNNLLKRIGDETSSKIELSDSDSDSHKITITRSKENASMADAKKDSPEFHSNELKKYFRQVRA